MTVFFVLLLCIAVMLVCVIGATLLDYRKSDAAGQGLTTAFTFFEAVALAVVLAVLLVMAAANGGLRGISASIAPLLYVGAVWGLLIALRILEKMHPGDRFQFLLRLITMACPGLLILYSAWSFFPGLRERIPALLANLGLGGPLILLSVTAWVVMGPGNAAIAARRQAQTQAFAEARRRDAPTATCRNRESTPATSPALHAHAPERSASPHVPAAARCDRRRDARA